MGFGLKNPILYGIRKAPDGYPVSYVPHNVLIDRNGRRVAVFIGDRYWMEKEKQELIQFLLAEPMETGATSSGQQ